MLRLAFDFIITWRETRTRPNAYNLLTFSKTPQGIDPEAPAGWGAYYPHVKTHSIGINITL